jgi:hypothetical protein
VPPTLRSAVVGFTGLSATEGGPQVFSMQDASSGSVRVRPGSTSVVVQLETPVAARQYQILVTPTFNAGAHWVPNRTTTSFVVEWERPVPAATREVDGIASAEFAIDFEVRAKPWPGNPTPLCCTGSTPARP